MDTTYHTPRSAGALTFSPDGIIFLGDSKLSAVFAFETERGQAPASLDPLLFESIDERIAEYSKRSRAAVEKHHGQVIAGPAGGGAAV
jgi:hypothetical protein